MPSKLLTNEQAAALLDLKPSTLPVWRCHGKGPRFIKYNHAVRYAEADVLEWLEQQKRTSTSDHSARETATA